MIAIIPVKKSSKRVIEKNFRPFYGNESLCDITLKKVLGILPRDKIYLSSESNDVGAIAKKYGVNFVHRNEKLVYNETPIVDVIKGVYEEIGVDEDVAWCQVTDPMFGEYEECLSKWNEVSTKGFDSLVVVQPIKKYLLNKQFQPNNFVYGYWHSISQNLSEMYQLNFTLSFLKQESINKIGYYVGEKPYWYLSDSISIDIDTEDEFCIAQIIYDYYAKKNNNM